MRPKWHNPASSDQQNALRIVREQMANESALSSMKSAFLINGGAGVALMSFLPEIMGHTEINQSLSELSRTIFGHPTNLILWTALAFLFFFLGAYSAIVAMRMTHYRNEALAKECTIGAKEKSYLDWIPGLKGKCSSKKAQIFATVFSWIAIICGCIGFMIGFTAITALGIAPPPLT